MDKLIKEIKGFLWALLVAVIIRTFAFQPFVIPSGSMYPTMMIGDFLFVSKYSWGYSHYSLPFAPPLFQGRVLEYAKPIRGQVTVFRCPMGKTESLLKRMMFMDDSLDFIKRLVGLPGDKIQVKKGVLHINGEAVKLEKIEDYVYHDPRNNSVKVLPQYIETLPNGVKHKILKEAPFGEGHYDNTHEITVPEGHYFMMGDNRDNSQDSREPRVCGLVPEDHLLGPAQIIFFSTDAKWYQVERFIPGIRPSRILQVIE